MCVSCIHAAGVARQHPSEMLLLYISGSVLLQPGLAAAGSVADIDSTAAAAIQRRIIAATAAALMQISGVKEAGSRMRSCGFDLDATPPLQW